MRLAYISLLFILSACGDTFNTLPPPEEGIEEIEEVDEIPEIEIPRQEPVTIVAEPQEMFYQTQQWRELVGRVETLENTPYVTAYVLNESIDELVSAMNERIETLSENDAQLLEVLGRLQTQINEMPEVIQQDNPVTWDDVVQNQRQMNAEIMAIIDAKITELRNTDWQEQFSEWMDRYSAWVCQASAIRGNISEECRETLMRRQEVIELGQER